MANEIDYKATFIEELKSTKREGVDKVIECERENPTL